MDVKKELQNKIETLSSSIYKAKKEFYRDHFYEFNRDVLGWPDIYEPLHRKVSDFITENVDKKKLLLLLPRGTFKSSIVTVGYSLYRIARNPEERILIANATRPMAIQFLGQIKKHLESNDEFIKMFGDLSKGADTWREDRIFVASGKMHSKEPTVWAQGAESNVVGSHFDIAILDDLVSDVNITTKEQIEKIKNYYRGCLDLVDPIKGGHRRTIIIGTTWHWDDLYAWIQGDDEMMQDFEVMRLPAFEGDWGKGDLLFPDRLNWDALAQQKRQQGSYHFSAQYMLDPIPAEDQTFKGPFKTFEETDLRGVDLKKFITVDPAVSEEKTADYSSMVCVGVDYNNTWYILDIWRDRVQPSRLLEQIFYWNQKHKPVSIGIETTAFQRALKYFLDDEMRKRNEFIPTKELGHTDRSKFERIKGLQPRYETGAVFHPQKTTVPLVEDLEDELMRFPLGRHDDIIDALASQLELAFPPKKREERTYINRSAYPA